MLELEELKKLHDKAYEHSTITRERSADDLVFYWVTQWDDSSLNDSQLAFRGEFNVLRKAGRQILSDLASNEVQVDFEPRSDTREDSAEVLDGLYRNDDNHNSTLDSYEVARQEAVVAGVGAWELYTEYESIRSESNKNQVIRRRPLHEANNCVYWDPNAKLLDKSDAIYCSVLTAYSLDGYQDLVKDLTGEECPNDYLESFKEPEQSYVFPWLGGSSKFVYISTFYHKEIVKDKILTLTDPFEMSIELRESSLTDTMDELIAAGFEITDEKEIQRYQITKYIASGIDILDSKVIVGEHIPVVPMFGEHSYVEGEEHWEGVTRCAKDPSRLRNFQLSYLADIVSRSPRQKPIFTKEQIAGFEDMYEETGSENNYPYYLQNSKNLQGETLPIGPIAVMPEQVMPQALVASIGLSKEAIEDVANPGLPQDIADPDLSGKAVLALQARVDMQSMIYQEHLKHAKRHDAVIYASMASEVYDVPRKIKVMKPDGTKQEISIMQAVLDEETGDLVILNSLINSEFDVYSTIGPSYNSQRDQTIDRLEQIIPTLEAGNPLRQALLLKLFKIMDGIDFEDIREYANKQLVLTGIKEPETDEEMAMVEEAAKNKQPSPEMVLALAEDKKGEAALLQEKRKGIEMQMEGQNKDGKLKVDVFKAQTDRMEAQIKAQEANVTILMKRIEAFGKELENTEKIIELEDVKGMTDDQLYQRVQSG